MLFLPVDEKRIDARRIGSLDVLQGIPHINNGRGGSLAEITKGEKQRLGGRFSVFIDVATHENIGDTETLSHTT